MSDGAEESGSSYLPTLNAISFSGNTSCLMGGSRDNEIIVCYTEKRNEHLRNMRYVFGECVCVCVTLITYIYLDMKYSSNKKISVFLETLIAFLSVVSNKDIFLLSKQKD